jgi:hypothetical protein
MGEESIPKYALLQTHYENLNFESGVRDSSGLRSFLTPNLREFDAGILTLGTLPRWVVMIPPGQPDFKVVGKCHQNCTQKVINILEFFPENMNIFHIVSLN